MTTDSPVVVLFNSDGYEVNVKNGVALPTVPTAILSAGTDGSNSRFIKVDSSGRQVVVGTGTAGTSTGGLITIQGDPAGTPVPVTGSVSVTNTSVGITGAAIPASATQIGGSDGTNLQVPRVFDLDTGGGTQYSLGVNLRLSSSGGSVEFGTNANPIRIDPTGTTTQPISAASLPLPSGAATEATLATRLADATFTARINTLGQKTMANSTPVVLASDQTVIPVSQSGTWTVQPGNTANTTPWLITISQGGNSATVTGSNALKVDGSAVTQPVSGTVTANAGTGNFTVVQATAANLNATVIQGTAANLRAQTSSESNTGSAVPTQAAMVGGSDGTNLRAISTDSSGRQIVIGAAAAGAAVTGNPVLVAGSDGTNVRTFKTLTDGTQVTRYKELATFTGVATDIAVANNKSIFSIVNASGSTVTVRISAIYITSVQTTAVTGVVGNFELRRITNHSAGTSITAIEKMDSTDSLNASVTVRTNGTVTSESTNLLWRSVFSTDEWSVNNAIDTSAEGHLLSTMFPIWKRADFDNKPIILNANEGLTVKFATNSSVGTFDIMIVFTQE